MLLVDIVLPLPLQGLYTYSVPKECIELVQNGCRVVVQFGSKKIYTGIILQKRETENIPEGLKEIISILDDLPIVPQHQLNFWEWLSSYYMCSMGDVYRAALPSALKLESETHIRLNPDFVAEDKFSPNELKTYHQLSNEKPVSIADLQKNCGINNIIPVIKSLSEKNAISISETIDEDYSAKKIDAVRFRYTFSDNELNTLLDSLKKAQKQYQLLLAFIELQEESETVSKKELLSRASATTQVLKELVKKDILQTYDYEINRIEYGEAKLDAINQLNEAQQKAYNEIKGSFATKDITLLHGVTSAGKTEIYIHLIREALKEEKQVLYLLPEIALTTQITERLKRIFGNKLGVYHSKFNDNERAEIWNRLLQNKDCKVILGARSAIFLPFTDLGLVIVDEEHESSYKQQDPSPRYNARNAAIILAGMFGAKTLLGTATPSIESYYNATTGRYALVELTKRYENIELPEIAVVNTKELRRIKQMKSILSPPLITQMKEVLANGEQVILFQNRRGFSSVVECKTCSWTPRCKHCDVSLTYHKGQNMMVCHYCGATYRVPALCEECKTPTLGMLGYGTERIEEEVKLEFPDAEIVRMDLDTTRGKKAYERIISDFEDNKTNILIGTQMVSKGLDFDNVRIVGILNADNMLNYPDFRAHERAFQLMTQVSGRAGRKNKQGVVLLQTSHPANAIVRFVKENDYHSFYKLQLDERKLFRYPPFFRLISVVIRSRYEETADKAATVFTELLRTSFGDRVLGPGKPPVSRVQSLYIRKIILKFENQASTNKVRDIIYQHQATLLNNPELKSILLHYDVDPV